MKRKIKLSKWAKLNNYTYNGAYNLFKTNGIEGAIQLSSGTILVEISELDIYEKYTIIYTDDIKTNLLIAFCNSKRWYINEIINISSDHLDLLEKLKQERLTRLVIKNKDIFTQSEFNIIKALFFGDIIIIDELKNFQK